MNGTVNVLCYRSKTLANGEHPLMICITKDGKRKYKSLGVSILPQHWDFNKNKPKRNCPNKDLITQLINNQIIRRSSELGIFITYFTNQEMTCCVQTISYHSSLPTNGCGPDTDKV